jgi:hypothetical protein
MTNPQSSNKIEEIVAHLHVARLHPSRSSRQATSNKTNNNPQKSLKVPLLIPTSSTLNSFQKDKDLSSMSLEQQL